MSTDEHDPTLASKEPAPPVVINPPSPSEIEAYEHYRAGLLGAVHTLLSNPRINTVYEEDLEELGRMNNLKSIDETRSAYVAVGLFRAKPKKRPKRKTKDDAAAPPVVEDPASPPTEPPAIPGAPTEPPVAEDPASPPAEPPTDPGSPAEPPAVEDPASPPAVPPADPSPPAEPPVAGPPAPEPPTGGPPGPPIVPVPPPEERPRSSPLWLLAIPAAALLLLWLNWQGPKVTDDKAKVAESVHAPVILTVPQPSAEEAQKWKEYLAKLDARVAETCRIPEFVALFPSSSCGSMSCGVAREIAGKLDYPYKGDYDKFEEGAFASFKAFHVRLFPNIDLANGIDERVFLCWQRFRELYAAERDSPALFRHELDDDSVTAEKVFADRHVMLDRDQEYVLEAAFRKRVLAFQKQLAEMDSDPCVKVSGPG